MNRVPALRSTGLAVCLALLLSPSAGAARSVAPEEALARLEAAAERCDLRSGERPLRVRALVRALRLSSGEHAGRYELAWDSPDRWRREIRFASYHAVEAHDEDGAWRSSGVPWVPVRVRQIETGLDVASLLRLAPDERVESARSRRAAGGRRLEIELTGKGDGSRRVELDEESGLPLAVRGPLLTHRFDDWQSVGELAFPREVTVSDSGGVIATATLRRFALERSFPESLFSRPDGARASDALPEPDAPEWATYRARLSTLFQRSWELPREAQLGREGVVRLAFEVRRDGQVRGLRLLESSGSEALDHGAIAAIAAAAPLPTPPLPPHEDALAISWSVVYNLQGDATSPSFEARRPRERAYPGIRPVTGPATDELLPIDELMLEFLDEQDAPGATLAVLKDGRLVHARGYGWADHGRGEPVRPDSLFRIASLSKPITAITLLSLVQDGLVSLDASPWGILGLEERAATADARHERLTLRLLLQHRGGIDRSTMTDPYLRAVESGRAWNGEPAPGRADLAEQLAARPLDFEPGARFAYSNAGYGLLGRVIEALSGVGYEQAVRERVLLPLGLEGPRIGRSRSGERAAEEVKPHLRDPQQAPAADGRGDRVPLAEGGFALEEMDSHGGWLASVLDLARISRGLDASKAERLLGRRSLRRLWARPSGLSGHDIWSPVLKQWYASGWHVRIAGPRGELEQWHGGRLPGSASRWVRQADGVQWIVLFNQDRGRDGILLPAALEPRLREALSRVSDWPELDLFEPR